MNVINKILDFVKSLFFNKNNDSCVVNSVTVYETDIDKKSEKEEVYTMSEVDNFEIMDMGHNKKHYNGLVVVLDPGHAVTTSGKRSPFSLGKVLSPELPIEEWELNREIAYILKGMLREYGVEVFITTNMDMDAGNDLALSKRAERANEYVKKSGKRGVFISIHADADGMGDKWTKAHGWSCFTTKGQNNSDILADCLYDAAESVFPSLGMTIRTDKKDGDRDWEENFTVIEKANMPAVLTENFFYTNIDDAKFLMTDEGKDAIATVHLLGILKFADTFYKM